MAEAFAGAPDVHQAPRVTGGKTLKAKKATVNNEAAHPFQATAAQWPKAASATANLKQPGPGQRTGAKATAGRTPVWARAVAAKNGSYSGPSTLAVRVMPHQKATDLGVTGVVFTVKPDQGQTGDVQVGLDATGFEQAYGGNYASRLQLVELPACALTTPQAAACRAQTLLRTSHDTPTSISTTLLGTGAAATPTPTVLAATSSNAASGAAGSYSATPLKPSGSWTASGSSGSFNYSYPIDLPGSSGQLEPSVDLGYDSGSVDGQTSSTQAQASWTGDGWSTPDSYIEQSFSSCAESPEGTASPVSSGDECYDGPILSLSLNGSSTSLVKDDKTGAWVPADDGGATVTHLTGSGNGSGTYNTDYWVVTERDGTKYEFGRNELPGWTSGKATTNSVDSEPVYSAHSGDPCYSASGFTSSVCTMAYKWHLDYVVDPHGDAMAYYYGQDTNYYGQDNGAHNVAYIRDSHLARIDYGFRDGGAYGTVPDQVVFTTASRCTLTSCDPLSSTTAASQYPDVPYDLVCASGAKCSEYSLSFFSTVRLASISTRQYSASTGTYLPVDTYTLHETEPATGDGTSPTLWLSSITHTGNDTTAGGSTSPITLPDVKFAGIDLQNRVDTSSFPGLYRYRISAITTEMGGVTSVSYGLPDECTPSYVSTANPSSNTKSCYPVSWIPKDYIAPITDWFEKYAVTQVLETDTTGGAVAQESDYTYSGGAAWHHDDNELVKAKYRTWGQFRGYGTVETQTGDAANDPKTDAVTTYYRGMDGDWLTATTTRNVSVTDSQGGSHPDSDELAGNELESTTYTGTGGSIDHSTITSYWVSPAVATRARTGLPDLTAHTVDTAEIWNRQALTDGGTTHWRYTETDTAYDATATDANFGLPTYSYTHTVPTDTRYDQCTSTQYTPANTTINLVGLPAFEESDSVACSGFTENTPSSVPKAFNTLTAPTAVNRPDQVISATRTTYDDPAFSTTFPQTAAPTAGDATMVREASGYTGGAFTWQTTQRDTYDNHGRTLTEYDGNGNKTTSAYTVNSVGLTTAESTTNAKNQTDSTTIDPTRGLTVGSKDANGLVTTAQFDALGRTTADWEHNRPTTQPADDLYTYTVSQTGPSGTTTREMNDSGGYVTSYTLYDSLGRDRQTQVPTPQGGRLIAESFYDSHGWVRKKNNSYWDPDNNPALTLASFQDSKIPNQDVYTFDGQGRTVVDDSEQYSVTKQQTTTIYNGDSTTVIPPDGGTVKATTTDPLGRTTTVASYGTPPTVTKPANTFTGTWYTTGGTSNAITYGYDGHNLQNATISGGSTWTSTFNLLGNVVSKSDPDAGTSTMAYDANGNLTQTTDANNKSVSFTYDALDRKTAQYAATTTTQAASNELASWIYDNDNAVAGVTNPIGQATTATSYNNGAAYITQQLGYNAFGESFGESVIIPSTAEGTGLGRTWTFKHAYTGNKGLPFTDTYPLAGGLSSQIVNHGYATALDLPDSLGDTSYGYAQGTTYTAYSQVAQETIGTGSNLAYINNTYDPHTGVLTDQLVTRSTTTPAKVDEQAYTYDPSGNITRQTSTRLGAAASETQCYQYDNLDRLTQAWTANDSCAATPTTTSHTTVSDSLTGGTAYWTSWTFDILGQRTSQTQHSTSGGADTTTSYTYNGNNTGQPHTLTDTQTTSPTGSTATDYTYDKAGNTLTRNTAASGNQTLTWNNAGQVTKVDGGTAGTTSYIYDADGNVLLQKDPGATTLYLPDQQITLNTTTNATTGVRYLDLPGGGTAVRTGTAANYGFEIADQHGTNGLRLDATAQQPTWRQFTPYGETRGTTISWTDNRGFLNAPTDTNTGLTLLGARQYDPTLGRFTSLDPLFEATDDQLLNGYSYTRDNPINQTDPTGLRPLGPTDGGTTTDYQWANDRGMNASYSYKNGKWVWQQTPKKDAASRKKYAAYHANPTHYMIDDSYAEAKAAAEAAAAAKIKADAARAKAKAAAKRKQHGILGSLRSGLGSTWDATKSGVEAAGKWTYDNRGMIVKAGAIAALGVCTVGTAGACFVVGSTAFALSVANRGIAFGQSKKGNSDWAAFGSGIVFDTVAWRVNVVREPGLFVKNLPLLYSLGTRAGQARMYQQSVAAVWGTLGW